MNLNDCNNIEDFRKLAKNYFNNIYLEHIQKNPKKTPAPQKCPICKGSQRPWMIKLCTWGSQFANKFSDIVRVSWNNMTNLDQK